MQAVVTAGKKTKTPTGIHVFDAETAQRRAAQGMQFLAVGSDLALMTKQAQQTLATLKPQQGGKDVARY